MALTLSVMSVADEVPEITRVPAWVLVKIRRHVSMTLSLMSVAVEVPAIVPVPLMVLVPVPEVVVAVRLIVLSVTG